VGRQGRNHYSSLTVSVGVRHESEDDHRKLFIGTMKVLVLPRGRGQGKLKFISEEQISLMWPRDIFSSHEPSVATYADIYFPRLKFC
jgi:hypothetical protein